MTGGEFQTALFLAGGFARRYSAASSLFRPRRFASLASGGVFSYPLPSQTAARRVRWFLPPVEMQTSCWRLEANGALLQLGEFRATVNPRGSEAGLTAIVSAAGGDLRGSILGIEVPSFISGGSPGPTDCYCRQQDLVVTYRETDARPVRVDARWRAAAPAGTDEFLAAIDLVVSVRTELLDSRPQVAVTTVQPAAEASRLTDAATAQFQTLQIGPQPIRIERSQGPGCLLLRTVADGLSYAEMVHPADFRESELRRPPGENSAITIRHRLFRDPLEKGVILRARVRGVFLPRDDDARVAAKCYAAFAASEPPLGT